MERRDLAGEIVALALVLVFSLALSYTEFNDGDLGFHLATGREVLASGAIPQTNVLSYTNPSYPWLLHQWLPGVLFELTMQAGGVGALQALKMALVGVTWLVAYVAARALTQRPFAAALGTLLAATAAAFRFEMRPHLFTHLALSATVCCVSWYLRARRLERPFAWKWLAMAALVPVLACHLHAGVIDSWLVLVALLGGAAMEPWRARLLRTPTLQPCGLREASLLGLGIAASIVIAGLSLSAYHPIGFRVLGVPFDMATDGYLAEHLIEFRPPSSFPLFVLGPYWLCVVVALASLGLNRRSLHTFWCFLLGGFLLLSLKHARLVFGFSVIAAPMLSLGVERTSSLLRRSLRVPLALALLAACLIHRYELSPPGTGFNQRTFPVYLFEYLERHRLAGQAYVSDAWAAPLLGRAYPHRRAFFDNRFDAYPRSFFLDVYQHIRYGHAGWDALLEHHGVDIVLMRYTSPGEARFQAGRPNLRQLLASDPRWALVTFDDQGLLFVRRRGVDASHAARWAIGGVDPDAMRFLVPPRETAPSLARELGRGHSSVRLLVLASRAERDAGNEARANELAARAAHMVGGSPP